MRIELTREQERKLVERTINHFTNNLFNFGEYWNCRTFETHKAKITWYSGTGNSFYIASKELNVDFNLYDEKTEIGHIKNLVKFVRNYMMKEIIFLRKKTLINTLMNFSENETRIDG